MSQKIDADASWALENSYQASAETPVRISNQNTNHVLRFVLTQTNDVPVTPILDASFVKAGDIERLTLGTDERIWFACLVPTYLTIEV